MKHPTISNELAAAWDSVFQQKPSSGWQLAWFDSVRGLLVVGCVNQAWRTQMRLVESSLAEKLNRELPKPIIRRIIGAMQEVHVLVTGSRTWDDQQAIADALLDVWHDATQLVSEQVQFTVVHGDCPTGADAMAKQWAIDNGVFHIAVPADWAAPCTEQCPPTLHRKTSSKHGEYCPLAGHHRNQRMVDMGADLVLAFRRNNSRGTTDCIRRAERAGIPVRILEDHRD